MKNTHPFWLMLLSLAVTSLACQALAPDLASNTPTVAPQLPTPTPLVVEIPPVEERAADEPVIISGKIDYTSPFFLDAATEPFIMLEDQAGFVARDRNHLFAPASQFIGPVIRDEFDQFTYSLTLPLVPQGTLLDLDNDGETDRGVQVFAVAYWSNIWGGPFLEERDGTGWSTGYASTITDPERDDEIKGGTLVIWAPDNDQQFPTGFGEDRMLFTADDPVAPVTSGYHLVDLSAEPFRIYKEAQPIVDLYEGEIAVNDYSSLGYAEAFAALFAKVSVEYPFTADKGLDWDALYAEFSPRASEISNDEEFYILMRDFGWSIPDGHIYIDINPDVFYFERGGSFGMVLVELSDGRVYVTQVIDNTPASRAGIETGAEIIIWDGLPVADAIAQVQPYLAPYSTEHVRRLGQVQFLTRYPPGTEIEFTYRDLEGEEIELTLEAEPEYDSLFATFETGDDDELGLPIESEVLDDSGVAYLRISTFSDDYRLMASLWERHIRDLIDNGIPGLIIDLRWNGGGSSGLARNFAEYFFDEEVELYRRSYYNELSGEFEYLEEPSLLTPAPLYYDGEIAVLVGPDCVSACEGFAYILSLLPNVTIYGHSPTAGAYGEVGRGQYTLPGDYSMQFPTGRTETLEGDLLIEGTGIVPDVLVPVTFESATRQVDAVLDAAIAGLR